MCRLYKVDRRGQKETGLSSGCITLIPWFNGCLVWNNTVLGPIEAVLCRRDEVCPLKNLLDETGVQNEGMSCQ